MEMIWCAVSFCSAPYADEREPLDQNPPTLIHPPTTLMIGPIRLPTRPARTACNTPNPIHVREPNGHVTNPS